MTIQMTTSNNLGVPFSTGEMPRAIQLTAYGRNIVSHPGGEDSLTAELGSTDSAKIPVVVTGNLACRQVQAANQLAADKQQRRLRQPLSEQHQVRRQFVPSSMQNYKQQDGAQKELPLLNRAGSLAERDICSVATMSDTLSTYGSSTYGSSDSSRFESSNDGELYADKGRGVESLEQRLNRLIELKRSQPTTMQLLGTSLASYSQLPLTAAVGAVVEGGAHMVGDAFKAANHTRQKLDELGLSKGPIGSVLQVSLGAASLAAGALVGVGYGVYSGASGAYQSHQSGATIGQSIATSFENANRAANPRHILNGAGRFAADVGSVLSEAIKHPMASVVAAGGILVACVGVGPALMYVLGKGALLGWWATKSILRNAFGLAGFALGLA